MVFTVKTSLQIRSINPKCGQKPGLDGKSHSSHVACLSHNFIAFFISFFFLCKIVNIQERRLHTSLSLVIKILRKDLLFSLYLLHRYTEFGGPIPHRPAEDLAFSVARFIQNGGSFINYYMVS